MVYILDIIHEIIEKRKHKNAVLEKSDMAFYVCRKILPDQIENASLKSWYDADMKITKTI